jgi:integrase
MITQMLFSAVAHQFVRSLDTAYAHRSNARLSDNTRRLYSAYARRAAESLGAVPLMGLTALHVRDYIMELKGQDLSPATIVGHFHVLKSVVESLRDEMGEPLVQRKFNLDFIGLPTVRVTQQSAPCATRLDVEKALAAGGEVGRLVALLAGTGLRISEALNIGRGHVYDPAAGTITVAAGKTDAAARVVCLPQELMRYCGSDAHFTLAQPRFRDKLRALGLPPFHAYRRFRATHCRSMRMIESILKSQLGHSKRGDVTSLYDRSAENFELVRNEVQRVGMGFVIPQ